VQEPGPNYHDCHDQGLTRCLADYDRPGLDGQVNPARRFTGTNDNDNSATVLINLPAP
jgi:hypothetical protein